MALMLYRNPRTLSPWRFMNDADWEMNRWFSNFGRDSVALAWMPAVDLRETPEAYHIEVELPGMKREDIDVSLIGQRVTISGERRAEHAEEQNGYRHHERRFGRFERNFDVPGGFDGENVEARYESGILYLTLPKREAHKPRRIDVKSI